MSLLQVETSTILEVIEPGQSQAKEKFIIINNLI